MGSTVRLCLCALCAIPTVLHPAETPPQTLCVTDEKPLFSCAVDFNHVVGGKLLAAGKTVSVCASQDLSTSSGYLKYRFGRSQQKVELSYPADKGHPRQYFRLDIENTSAKASAEQLSFSSGDYSYIVFVERAAFEWNGSGVLVKSHGKLAAYFPCHKERPEPDRLYELGGLGLPTAQYEDIQADLQ